MHSVVLIESNAQFLDALKNEFERGEDFKVEGIATDGSVGLTLIEKYRPSAAVVGLVLAGEDGLGVLKRARKTCPETGIFITSGYSDDRLVSRAIDMGAKYIFIEPVQPTTVVERVRDIFTERATVHQMAAPVRDRKKVALDERLCNMFVSMGIPASIMGYQYLRLAVKFCVEEPGIINSVTKRLYPQIAGECHTTPSKVERAIRHAIEVAWNRGRAETVNAIFGVKIFMGNDRPTNSEFIALVADKMIFEELA